MVIGRGFRRTVGPGSGMNRGVGRRITTAAGSFTTTTGPGCRAASFTRSEVGGGPRSSLSSRLISLSETTSAGIRCRTTSGIRIHDITGGMIVRVTVVAIAGMVVNGVMTETVCIKTGVV